MGNSTENNATAPVTPEATTTPGLSMQELRSLILQELKQGRTQEAAADVLVARGWPEVTAQQFVVRTALSIEATAPVRQDSARVAWRDRQVSIRVYKRRMVRGLLWMLGGIAISLASANLVQSYSGGTFMFLGTMLFGMIDFLAGLIGWWRSRK